MKQSSHCDPFYYIKNELEVDNPYSHLINLYKSIEDEIAKGRNVDYWRLFRAGLDNVVEDMYYNKRGVE